MVLRLFTWGTEDNSRRDGTLGKEKSRDRNENDAWEEVDEGDASEDQGE